MGFTGTVFNIYLIPFFFLFLCAKFGITFIVKGTVSRDFRNLGFFHQSTGSGPDSRAEAVSHMASNSPRDSILKSEADFFG
jgi:hypothetical protein